MRSVLDGGAIPQGGLYDLMELHVTQFDLIYRLPSFAQVASSNLMWQPIGTMGQTLSGVKNPDMLAPAESKFTLFVGHDTNLTATAGFLDVTRQAEGFRKNDPSPAGALVFELHRVKQSGQLIVRLFFVSVSLDQMRNGTELTLQAPPQRVPLTISACANVDCTYEQFKTFFTKSRAPGLPHYDRLRALSGMSRVRFALAADVCRHCKDRHV